MKVLRRSDLVNQFESIVLQEIKKYNDSVLESTMQINRLKSDLNKMLFELEEHKKLMYNEFEALKNSNSALIYHNRDKAEEAIGNNRKLVQQLRNEVNSVAGQAKIVSENSADKSQLKEFESYINQKMEKFTESITANLEQTKSNYYHQYKLLEERMEKFMEDLKNRPNEFDPFSKKIEKMLDLLKVDSNGITSKLNAYKQDLFIVERKIENIYRTLTKIETKLSD